MRVLARHVVALCHDTRPCRRPLPVTIQNLYHYPSPYRARTSRCVAAPSDVSQPWRIVSRPKVAPLSHDIIFFCIATQGPLSSRYKLCIAASSLVQAARAARRVVGLLCRVARTIDCIVAVPNRVAPPSYRAQACVPAQPAVCLLSLLCATILPAVL